MEYLVKVVLKNLFLMIPLYSFQNVRQGKTKATTYLETVEGMLSFSYTLHNPPLFPGVVS